ncbi:MAG: hypothetical protein HY367_01015 [Candidatus Aenigmarchaeota archaeon]|nr:hypothetical protein [Candidatus Aenigmarchaeota archaeon]
MSDPWKPREECGIVVAHSLHDTYKALKALQHRGQEAAGIAAMTGKSVSAVRWKGLVDNFSLRYLHTLLDGGVFIGHVRYSTSGSREKILKDAHPHCTGGNDFLYGEGRLLAEGGDMESILQEGRGSHIITTDARTAAIHNGTLVDHNELTNKTDECDTRTLLKLYSEIGPEELLRKIPAAYSAAFLNANNREVVCVRDRFGIRPCWIGKKDGKYVIASEDRAIMEIGGTPIREVAPGEAVYIKDGEFEAKQIIDPETRFCFFEYVYLAHPESTFNGHKVREARYRLGVELAGEFRPPDADMVSFVPNAPEPVARGYSSESDLPFAELFYKMREEDRSFMIPHGHGRSESIERNLYVLDNVNLEGKNIVLVDDSIVRGNVSQVAVMKLKKAGARKVYFLSASPPIGIRLNGENTGCLYGVDMPPTDNFAIKRCGSVERIRDEMGADALHYISFDGLYRAIQLTERQSCNYCISGIRPDRPLQIKSPRSI